MCLALYLGTERPIVAAPALGPLRLERLAYEAAPTALKDQASVYRIGSSLAHRSSPSADEPTLSAQALKAPIGCGCVFRETGDSDSLAAYAGLRALFGDILGGPRDAAALLGCWSGEERLEPSVEMAVSVSELSAEIELFSDVIHGWPILLRVTAPTAARRAVAAGDR